MHVVPETGYRSNGQVQRHMGMGYGRAANSVERMAQEGVVGTASGKAGGRRKVLVTAL